MLVLLSTALWCQPGFDQVDRGFAEVRGRLDGTTAGIEQITALLNTLISQ
jgi:hypothetical protein